MHPANSVATLLQKTLAGQVAGSPSTEPQITELRQTGHKLYLKIRDEHGEAHDVLVRVQLMEKTDDSDPLSYSRDAEAIAPDHPTTPPEAPAPTTQPAG